MSDTRGWRNHNPLNIDYHADMRWDGLDSPPSDGRFCRFKSLAYGLRAGIINARSYKRKHNIRTLGDYMARFAPLGPENSAKYHDFVSQKSGHRLNDPIDLESRDDLQPILRAQISYENGTPLNEVDVRVPVEVWNAAWSLAKPITKSRTIGGAVGTAVTIAASAVTQVAVQNAPDLATTHATASVIWPKWAWLITTIVGLGFVALIVYARLTAREEGAR